MYSNFKEIEYNLERLDLERKIAYEELKVVKDEYVGYFKPISWLQSGFKFAGKYGLFVLLKKLVK
ncbi:hypothetical protein [Sediminibacter sp. Hel_I_10]|uniref:hypothetical protein n=1 Tax=Sediminibacter sp. Hel_I_10 TaxID=1392490 RepID=UPI00047AD891|nr:hypothetical protein [Sediminibacter sp. Hel_I_10]